MKQNRNFNNAMEKGNHLKNRKNLISQTSMGIVLCVIFFASCSTAKIYTKPDVMAYATKHKTLAILPPEVKIEIKKNEKIENKQEQEKVEAINAQNELYSRLLAFVQKRNIHLEIQDIEKTNAALLKNGYANEAVVKMTPEELAETLGVDAILQSNYMFSYQKNVGLGIAYAIVFFPYGTPWGIMVASKPTNFVDVNMRFYDGTTGTLLYSYNDKFGGLNAKYIILIDKATKKVVKKSPYYRK